MPRTGPRYGPRQPVTPETTGRGVQLAVLLDECSAYLEAHEEHLSAEEQLLMRDLVDQLGVWRRWVRKLSRSVHGGTRVA